MDAGALTRHRNGTDLAARDSEDADLGPGRGVGRVRLRRDRQPAAGRRSKRSGRSEQADTGGERRQDNQQTRSPGCPYPQDPLSSLQSHTEYRFTTYHTQYGFGHKSPRRPWSATEPPGVPAPACPLRPPRLAAPRSAIASTTRRVVLYEANGIDAARVEDVIAEAGVSWATFFRYFPRKEDVLIEHAARHFRDRGEGGGRARAARRAAAGSDGHRTRLRGPTSSRRASRPPCTATRCSRSSRIRRASRRSSTTDIPSRWSGSRPSCSPRPSTAAR